MQPHLYTRFATFHPLGFHIKAGGAPAAPAAPAAAPVQSSQNICVYIPIPSASPISTSNKRRISFSWLSSARHPDATASHSLSVPHGLSHCQRQFDNGRATIIHYDCIIIIFIFLFYLFICFFPSSYFIYRNFYSPPIIKIFYFLFFFSFDIFLSLSPPNFTFVLHLPQGSRRPLPRLYCAPKGSAH